MSDKIFIGKVEKKQTQYGELTKISLNTADLDKIKENMNEKGWINIVMKEGKNGNPYLQIDNWKPSGAPAQQTQQEAAPRRGNFAGQDDLPF